MTTHHATDYVSPTLWTMAGLFASLALSPVGTLIGLLAAGIVLVVAWVVSR